MPLLPDLLLVVGVLLIATLYASVGHAGATGYLALMALAGLAPSSMRPTALVVNLLVASIAVVRFSRDGLLPLRTLMPFLIGSIPAAFVAGGLAVSDAFYRPLLALVLLLAAVRLAGGAVRDAAQSGATRAPHPTVAALVGTGIGVLAGITGTGGGVFLTPLVIARRWTPTRAAAGLSAGFILANSAAGLLARPASLTSLPTWLPAAMVAGAIGALLGTELGIRRLSIPWLRRLLALVMLFAAMRLVTS
ncbi:MAG: sulfite exporter TauE/SafE family protein [Candidatus Limnocylindrus sp.]